jgi:integrase
MSRRCLGFKLTQITRESGNTAWRVTGTLNGEQLKPEFDSKVAAIAEQEKLNALLFGHGSTLAPVITRLSGEEVEHAETVLAQLEAEFPGVTLYETLAYFRTVSPVLSPYTASKFNTAFKAIRRMYSDIDLADICAWFLANYQPSNKVITLKLATEHYVKHIDERRISGSIGYWQFRSIGFATGRLEAFFKPQTLLGDLTTLKLQDYVDAVVPPRTGKSGRKKASSKTPERVANKTKVNRRSYLIGFFKFCIKKGWIEKNPALALQNYSKRELHQPEPSILTVHEAEVLMSSLEFEDDQRRLIPFFVLTLFCGIRPTFKEGEIARINQSRIDLEAGTLILRKNDTKTKRARIVKLQPNVIDWLKTYPPGPLSRHPAQLPEALLQGPQDPSSEI